MLLDFFRVSLLCMIALIPQHAAAQEMKSINDFLNAEGPNPSKSSELVQIQFIGLRCSALYLIMSELMANNNMKKEEMTFRRSAESSFEMAVAARGSASDDFIKKQMEYMVQGYSEKMQRSRAASGDMLADRVVSSDLNSCGVFVGNKN